MKEERIKKTHCYIHRIHICIKKFRTLFVLGFGTEPTAYAIHAQYCPLNFCVLPTYTCVLSEQDFLDMSTYGDEHWAIDREKKICITVAATGSNSVSPKCNDVIGPNRLRPRLHGPVAGLGIDYTPTEHRG